MNVPSAKDVESTLRSSSLGTYEVEVIDESHLHAGHAGSTGGRHYRVRVVATAFEGKPLVARHRMVNALFADALKSGAIHALALVTVAPSENR
jgi:BolA protein